VQDSLKGHIDLLLLAALEREPTHGYGLVQVLHDTSDGTFALAEGTIYPALYRLERRGLVSSGWESVGRRRRRIYRLTRRGRAELARQHAAWKQFARATEAVLA
jgi:PadR family transcriptional regulator, regulatory protein PadR